MLHALLTHAYPLRQPLSRRSGLAASVGALVVPSVLTAVSLLHQSVCLIYHNGNRTSRRETCQRPPTQDHTFKPSG
jgi:hypothetical protein